MIGIQYLDLKVDILGIPKGKNLRLKPQLSLRNHLPKIGYILIELGSLYILGLLANLNG